MPDRTCASCGARVGVLVDRCPACGADPDLQLIELGIGAGRRRRAGPPAGDGDPRRPGRRIGWRQWAPVAAAVLGLWGFLLATAGEDGDEDDSTEQAEPESSSSSEKREEPTPSTRRGPRAPTTTTSTTTVIDGAPFVAETGLVLVLLGDQNRVVELDTGVTRRLPQDLTVWGSSGGRLLVSDRDGLAWWPAPFDGTGAQRLGMPAIEQAWADPAGELVWVITSSAPTERTLILLDATGERLDQQPLPVDAWAVGVVTGGVVLNAPGGTFLREVGGDVRRLSTGSAMGAGGDRVFVNRCDESLECGTETVGLDGEVLDERPSLSSSMYRGPYDPFAVSVDGRSVQAVDLDGSTTVAIDGVPVQDLPTRPGQEAAAWSPDGHWLFISNVAGGVYVVDPSGPAVVADFPAPRGESVWQLVVVDVDG